MDQIYIERVEKVTQELLVAFERLIPQLTQSPVPSAQDLQRLLDSPSILILARLPRFARNDIASGQNSPIVGAATLGVFHTPSGTHAHVEDVIVDEQFRGKKIGEALVRHLLQLAREMGLNGVSLTCNPRRTAANQFYLKLGFKKWDTNVSWYDL